MNEDRFRSLMRDAVGDAPMAPWLNGAVRARIARPQQAPNRAPVYALTAACIALAVVFAALAPRILRMPASPASTSTPSVSATLQCTLPVIADYPARDDLSTAAPVGFLNTKTGLLTVDRSASASVATMPSDYGTFIGSPRPPQALSYSPAVEHWLPVGPNQVSPDGRSYAYLGPNHLRNPTGAAGATLWRYDITTGKSTLLWTTFVDIYVFEWTPAGIIVGDTLGGNTISWSAATGTVVEPISMGLLWMIDPVRLTVTALKNPAFVALPGDLKGSGLTTASVIGLDYAGRSIWDIVASRPLGPPYKDDFEAKAVWVFYETAPGKRVYIFKGTTSGPVGFFPGPLHAVAAGIWFAGGTRASDVWYWTPKQGLREIVATGASQLDLSPAGPCF